jgi:hypothetical protein
MVIQGASGSPSQDRLTEADQAELLARWPNGGVVEVETATSSQFNCFVATDDGGVHQFLFWRDLDGQYIREDTRTGVKKSGSSVRDLMPLAL